LKEEEYEWGNPKSKHIIPEPNDETEQAIAAAAYKWRIKLRQEPDGPFFGMVALLMLSGEKYDQFKRLIEAGGGSVMQARYAFFYLKKKKFYYFSIICDHNSTWFTGHLMTLVLPGAGLHTASSV